MRLRRCLASTALLVLLGSPTGHAAPVPDPTPVAEPPIGQVVEVRGMPDRIRPATPVELTASARNTGEVPLLLEPRVEITGATGHLAPEQVRLEIPDPVHAGWTPTPLDPRGGARLPFPGPGAIDATSGRLAPGASVEFRVRFTIAANVPAQFVQVLVGGRPVSPGAGDEPRFVSGYIADTALLGPDGAMPTRPPDPGGTRAPSVPDAGTEHLGGTAKVVPTARRSDGPTFDLVGVPGWLRAGAGAAEFRVTFGNDTDRIIPAVRPELVFTSGQSPITPQQLVVEAYDDRDRSWFPVPLAVLTDPANGRDAHLVGELTPKPWDGRRPLPPGELTAITVRVSIPTGSPVAGGDLAVLVGGGAPEGTDRALASRSDFRVFHVPNAGVPPHPPKLRPELPPTAPDSAAGQREEDENDSSTLATVAIWVVLAGVGATIVYFARRNRRQGAGIEPDPGA